MFGAYRGVSFDENASLGILQHLDKDELQRLMDDDSKLQDLITDLQQVLEINIVCTNPLHATFFWENVKIHLHLLSFLNTEMAQVGYIFLRKFRGLRKSKTCSSKTVNPMAADDSETQGAKTLCYYSHLGVVSQRFQELSKIFSWNLCIAEIILLVWISSWNFVRVPKAMLWAHIQSFNLKFSPELWFPALCIFTRLCWRAREMLVKQPPDTVAILSANGSTVFDESCTPIG